MAARKKTTRTAKKSKTARKTSKASSSRPTKRVAAVTKRATKSNGARAGRSAAAPANPIQDALRRRRQALITR